MKSGVFEVIHDGVSARRAMTMDELLNREIFYSLKEAQYNFKSLSLLVPRCLNKFS